MTSIDIMKVLVLGTTGRVGFALTKTLLARNIGVRAIVRSEAKFKEMLHSDNCMDSLQGLDIVEDEVTKMSAEDFAKHIRNHQCTGVAVALGHRLNTQGLFTEKMFVSEVTRQIFDAIESLPAGSPPIRYAILSTPGFFDPRSALEPRDITFNVISRAILKMLQVCLVPPADNQKQANVFLSVPLSAKTEWVAVRPFNFVEEPECQYLTIENMTEDVFAKGKTSIVNIGRFMADLFEKDDVWQKWKGKTVVMKNSL